ncbi:metalloregulator ArsR/SmtB family transcription factor [Acidithiobacillus sp. AMEEHan]|uniref:ArsR/SmtB family transcription factor n=1 Tax=Acidithiobacillus sp. AMEEHan TaxID=2994951 RepID=UPI0027E40032|nr:metalloregulator ArsR/SmtB family transcription factor [Acidithiobacillus sp. AMEEHan]
MSSDTVRYALFSEVFAALAHPKRLEMIHYLGEGQKSAGEIAELTKLSKANVSQHLSVLKARGLVHCDKCGTFCHYRLTSPKVLETCEIVRELILDQMQTTSQLQEALSTVVPLRKGEK